MSRTQAALMSVSKRIFAVSLSPELWNDQLHLVQKTTKRQKLRRRRLRYRFLEKNI